MLLINYSISSIPSIYTDTYKCRLRSSSMHTNKHNPIICVNEGAGPPGSILHFILDYEQSSGLLETNNASKHTKLVSEKSSKENVDVNSVKVSSSTIGAKVVEINSQKRRKAGKGGSGALMIDKTVRKIAINQYLRSC